MNAAEAISSSSHTIGLWGTLPGWIMALSSSGILGFVANLWFRSRKLRMAENADDRAGYGDVIRTLRDEVLRLQQDHTRCEDRLSLIESKQATEKATHEAVIALLRHRANNSDQCLDALLMLLEAAPERVAAAVTQIKEMRVRQKEAEALEKAAIHNTNILRTME